MPARPRSVSSVVRCFAASVLGLFGGVGCGPSVNDSTPNDASLVDAWAPPLRCSADLQDVVDLDGQVVTTCAPDQACDDGRCVAPCTAAGNSHGNVGCEFLVPTPRFHLGSKPPCFAVFVANNWPSPARLIIERDGEGYDATQLGRLAASDPDVGSWQPVPATGIPAGQVAVLFLSHDPDAFNNAALTCPVSPGVSAVGGTAVTATGIGHAWSISTDVPVSMYDILPFGGASSYLPSAELVLPTTAWGGLHVAVMPKPSSTVGGPPWAHVVAAEDDTTIFVRPTIDLPWSVTIDPAPADAVTSFRLDRGEYIQWMFANESQDMSGSLLTSDKPITFVGGNAYICYASATSEGGGCDSAHQQIPPLNALGSEYVGAPFISRGSTAESLPYRIVGTVDGTALTYDPPVAGAPATLERSQVVDFESTVAFAVTSQSSDYPFYVGQMMPGCVLSDGTPECVGDEEFVNVLPPAQFLSRYVFFTDPSYPRTDLVFVRRTTDPPSPVNLACLGEVTGWTAIGATAYETATVALLDSCTNGPHVASSDAPFGVTVWGMATTASYAYPAGGNVSDINPVDIVIE